MSEIPTISSNPLFKHFRQPKMYLTLPSNGRFYPAGSLNLKENGEYAVFPMTAKDELTLKTPDALLNGQATVDIIQSCIPDIKDAWQMPSLDIDATLVAIRMATYGDKLEMTITVPGTKEEKTFIIELSKVIESLLNGEFDTTLHHDGLTLEVKPLSYQEFTKSALKTFEEQRIISIVNDDSYSEEQKLQHFTNSFKKLTDINISMVAQSIASISLNDDAGTKVTNRKHIEEFINNADKGFFKAVVSHLETQKNKFSIKPIRIDSTAEEKALGAPDSYEVPVSFDTSNFFV